MWYAGVQLELAFAQRVDRDGNRFGPIYLTATPRGAIGFDIGGSVFFGGLGRGRLSDLEGWSGALSMSVLVGPSSIFNLTGLTGAEIHCGPSVGGSLAVGRTFAIQQFGGDDPCEPWS